MSDETINDLLERLSTTRVDAAWSEFLARYSPLIMHLIRRHESDGDRATECFLHVCGALSDDGFRRLRGFRRDGPARFKSWLIAVIANLCSDWRRREEGRVRLFRSISRLPELDRQVYRCIYLRGMSRAQCVAVLAPQYPELTDSAVSEINARLFALLTPQQRWRLSTRAPVPRPVRLDVAPEDDDPAWQLETPGPGPEALSIEMQEQSQLQDALARLPAEQRLLLRMRYEQALTLAEIARLTGQPDPFRTNRKIQAAVDALADLLGVHRFRAGRKKP